MPNLQIPCLRNRITLPFPDICYIPSSLVVPASSKSPSTICSSTTCIIPSEPSSTSASVDDANAIGYTKGLSCKLQGLTLDVIQGCEMIKLITSLLANARSDKVEYDIVFEKISTMVALTCSSGIPKRCGKQTQCNNAPAYTPQYN